MIYAAAICGILAALFARIAYEASESNHRMSEDLFYSLSIGFGIVGMGAIYLHIFQ